MNILLRATCSCSCEDLNKPAPQSHWRSRLRRKDKAGISIEDLSCSTSQHLIAYNSLVNLLQDRLCNDTERPEVIYQNDVQTLLTSIVGKRTEPSYSHLFKQSSNGIKFVGNLCYSEKSLSQQIIWVCGVVWRNVQTSGLRCCVWRAHCNRNVFNG